MKNIEKYRDRLKNMPESDLCCCVCSLVRKGQCYEECTTCKEKAIDWLCSEYKEPVLDETERKYLSEVLKPFKLYITSVTKDHYTDRCCEEREFIHVRFLTGGWLFPTFKAGTMYKGMATGRRYTLEELDL